MPKRDLILLALDPSQTLKLMESALSAVNYETAVASDTKTLSRLMQETTPALILVGETFDGHDGLDIIDELVERFPTLPFLIYIEKVTPELVKRIFKQGVAGYLAPPLKAEDILDIVEGMLAHAQRVGDWVRREVKKTTSSLKKRAKLSESERARFEAVFNTIEESVMILDEEQSVLFVNSTVCRTLGLDVKAAIGRNVLDVITHPDIRALVSGRVNSKTSDNDEINEVNFPDGRVANAQFAAVPDIGFVLTLQDITYLKEVDRVRNEVIHTVSHDLRSPLTSVVGYTELISRSGSLNDIQRDFLNRIQESVNHITSLINDLLELGSIEAGLDTRREMVQMEALIRYTLEMLQGQIKTKRIQVRTEIAASLPAISANPVRLRQVVDNVIGNAIKYSHKDGEVEISLQVEDEQIIFKVKDNGPGIPAQDQTHIFDKFYRGTNMVKNDGSGLGLAIVKSIVDAHQGRIWVESTLGQGSAFFIVLPIKRITASLKK